MATAPLEAAKREASLAVEADTQKRYPEAFARYKQAAQLLLEHIESA